MPRRDRKVAEYTDPDLTGVARLGPAAERREYAPVGGETAASPRIYPTGVPGSVTGDRKVAQYIDPDSTGVPSLGSAAPATRLRARRRRRRG